MGIRTVTNWRWDWLGTASSTGPGITGPGSGPRVRRLRRGEAWKRSWLKPVVCRIFPLVGWAEQGGYDARGHGNSVPRFHITWGTGPALVEIFAKQLRGNPRVTFAHRHRWTT